MLLRQSELGEDRVDVFLDGALCEDEIGRDRGIVLALGDRGEDFALTRRQRTEG
jgi:hypothetical protein